MTLNYSEFIKKEEKRIKITPVLDLIKNLEGKNVLVYSHDDPDGITSALIFTRLMKKLQINYKLEIPSTMELEEEPQEEAVQPNDVTAEVEGKE